jgi:hypothetical protein
MNDLPRFTWDTAPPADRKVEAETMSATAKGMSDLRASLAAVGIKLDDQEIVNRFGISVAPGKPVALPGGEQTPPGNDDGKESKQAA